MTRQELSEQLRKLRNIPAPKLAEESGLREAQISLIENGKVNFTIDKLLKYCNHLGIKIKFEKKGKKD